MTAAPPIPRTAFVLGGGGVLGATQIGMLRVLLERGVRPDLVVGTSIGAVNGAFVAADPTPQGLDRLAATWTELAGASPWSNPLARQDGRPSRPRLSRPRLRANLYPPGPVLRLLRARLPVQRLEDTQVPFQCVAASIERAVAHWFTAGPAAEAILASCAAPGLFPAIRVGDEHFLDGGLVHSIPVGRAVALGATTIYVLHVGRVEQPLTAPRWPWEVAQVTFEIARRHRYMEEIRSVPEGVTVHALPSGAGDAPLVSVLHRSTRYVTERIDAAYDATSDYLDTLSSDGNG